MLLSIPRQLGEKFVYKKVNPTVRSTPVKHSLDLLSQARLSTKIKATAANGMPLGAEIQENFIKVILLDVGLCSTILDLSLPSFANIHEITLVNSGGIAEQVVGQLLRTINPFMLNPHCTTGSPMRKAPMLKSIILYRIMDKLCRLRSKREWQAHLNHYIFL